MENCASAFKCQGEATKLWQSRVKGLKKQAVLLGECVVSVYQISSFVDSGALLKALTDSRFEQINVNGTVENVTVEVPTPDLPFKFGEDVVVLNTVIYTVFVVVITMIFALLEQLPNFQQQVSNLLVNYVQLGVVLPFLIASLLSFGAAAFGANVALGTEVILGIISATLAIFSLAVAGMQQVDFSRGWNFWGWNVIMLFIVIFAVVVIILGGINASGGGAEVVANFTDFDANNELANVTGSNGSAMLTLDEILAFVGGVFATTAVLTTTVLAMREFCSSRRSEATLRLDGGTSEEETNIETTIYDSNEEDKHNSKDPGHAVAWTYLLFQLFDFVKDLAFLLYLQPTTGTCDLLYIATSIDIVLSVLMVVEIYVEEDWNDTEGSGIVYGCAICGFFFSSLLLLILPSVATLVVGVVAGFCWLRCIFESDLSEEFA